MTPEVILLRIDHWAKRATPSTAKREERSRPKSLKFTPQISVRIAIAVKVNAKEKYLTMRLVRA